MYSRMCPTVRRPREACKPAEASLDQPLQQHGRQNLQGNLDGSSLVRPRVPKWYAFGHDLGAAQPMSTRNASQACNAGFLTGTAAGYPACRSGLRRGEEKAQDRR